MVFMSATRRPVFALAALLLALPAGADPMSEDLRSSVGRIVILPIPGESGEAITGTYDKETAGLAGGAARGAEIGQVPVEVGHVPVNIPIPILRELGMLVGGLTGAAERRTQELRDRLTEDLASEVEQPLSNVALATDVFWGLHGTRDVEPKLFAQTTPIPADTDAIERRRGDRFRLRGLPLPVQRRLLVAPLRVVGAGVAAVRLGADRRGPAGAQQQRQGNAERGGKDGSGRSRRDLGASVKHGRSGLGFSRNDTA